MQILKEELKEIILEKSEQEFLEKGFQNASLRTIAKQSGTTIGNLYHYFVSKEALFDELVKDEYASFLYLLEHHSEMEIPNDLSYHKDIFVWKSLFEQYLDELMPIFTKRFLLLFDKSEGTKYQYAKNKIVRVLVENLNGHLETFHISATPGFSLVIAEQLLNSFLFIVENHEDEQLKKQLICDTMLFYIAGILRLAEN